MFDLNNVPAHCSLVVFEKYTDGRYSDDPMRFDSIHYGDLKDADKPEIALAIQQNRLLIRPILLSGSDYSGSTVEKSNYQVFLRLYGDQPGVFSCPGNFSTYSVVIVAHLLSEEMNETLNALADYPVIDDDAMSELEQDLIDEAWDNWIREDFVREVGKKFKIEISDYDHSLMKKVFDEAEDGRSTVFVESGCSVFADTKVLAERLDFEDVYPALEVWYHNEAELDQDDFKLLVKWLQNVNPSLNISGVFSKLSSGALTKAGLQAELGLN
jgi:hypothetical protein